MKAIIGFYFVLISLNVNCDKTFSDQFISKSRLGEFHEFGVSTDSKPCARIGREILENNGTAADSIISILLCMGVTIPESMGLGGGSLIIFYNRTAKDSYVIDAREEAPKAASHNMFHNDQTLSLLGPLGIGIPGELSGYWELHRRSGKIPWIRLFDGAIHLSRYGFKVGQHLANAIKLNENHIKNHTSLSETFVNNQTGEVYKENEKLVQLKLAETLEMLANSSDPLKLFYEGIIAQNLINDIKDAAKEWNRTEIITLDDLKSYKVDTKRNVVKTYLKRGNLTLHTMPLPGSGLLLGFIMKVMEGYDDMYPNASKSLKSSVLFYHRLVETYKYAYSRRMLLGDDLFENVKSVVTNLTSQQFIDNVHNSIIDSKTFNDSRHYGADVYIKADHGTAHVSVIDRYGNAAAVSTSVNMYFGSKVLSKRTGFILNNQMDDFASNFTNGFGVPPSDHNLIEPGKRPLSSMCPSIFVDHSGNVRLVIGASGGTKITTAVASVAIRHLWLNETIKQAIDWPRIHHQLFPNEITYESDFPEDILMGLKGLGHKIKSLGSERGAIVMAVSRDDNAIYANSDFRKGGDVDGV